MPTEYSIDKEELDLTPDVGLPFLDNGKEFIDGNIYEEDRGYKGCSPPYVVFGELTNVDRLFNDVTSAWRTGDVVSFTFFKKVNGLWKPANYLPVKTAFANESNAWFGTVEWRDVLDQDGAGCFKLVTNSSIAGSPQPFINWGIYTLEPYLINGKRNPTVARYAARILSEFNDMNNYLGLDFTNSFVLDSVRMDAKIGYFDDNTEIDMVEYLNRKNQKVTIEDFETYELRLNASGFCVVELLRMHLLQGNNQWISDYNYDSYSYLMNDVPVVLEEGFKPEHNDGSRLVGGVVKFKKKVSNKSTSFNNNRITAPEERPPILCPLAININKSTLLMKTNAQSYISGDDGQDQAGREVGHFTLNFNNPYGNSMRYTDTLGGQVFANGLVLDWSQRDINGDVMMIYNVKQANQNLPTAISTAKSTTIAGFVGFEVPNINEAHSLSNWNNGSNRALSTPFPTFGASAPIFHPKTLQNSTVNWSYTYTGNGVIGRILTTTPAPYFLIRKTTMAELGL